MKETTNHSVQLLGSNFKTVNEFRTVMLENTIPFTKTYINTTINFFLTASV